MLTADLIHGLTLSCLAARYDEPKPIPAVHLEWWALCCEDHPQVAIAAPRGHAKSTAITFAYVLAALLFRASRHCLILSSNESLASDFLGDLKVELQENETLQQAFGPFRFFKEAEAELIVGFPNGDKFRVIAKGAGQRMRGLKWERKRPDLVVGDDLEDDEIVLNEERREKFRRWFYGAVRPILRQGGLLRLVGTIIHLDSLLERTMPRAKDPETLEEPLRIASTNPERAWRSVKYRAHSADYAHILWPAQFPARKLKEIRREYAEMGLLDVYGQEYLNDPIDDTTAYFRREDFLPMSPRDLDRIRDKRLQYYVGGDLAITKDKKNACTCFVIGGVDDQKTLHIVDVRRGRWDTLEIIEELFNIQERWSPDLFRMESENIEKTLKPVLDAEMVRRQVFLNYDSEPPKKDKLQRARAFQFRMRAGNVRFDKSASWYADYEEELTHFPKWPTLDQVDASAWLGILIAEEIAAPTERDLEDERYEAMQEAEAMGASPVTGY